jgi:hypothetical protein
VVGLGPRLRRLAHGGQAVTSRELTALHVARDGQDSTADGDGTPAQPPDRVAVVPAIQGRTMRDRLIDLATERFTLGVTGDDRVFLVDRQGRNVALFASRAKTSLAAAMRKCQGQSPGRTALDEAWQTIEGLAQDVPKTALPIRVAEYEGGSVLDLGDVTGRAVVLDASGWRIVDRSPVTFKRTSAMAPLPVPDRGGSIDPLWRIANIKKDQRHLFIAWLASLLLPALPHPIPLLRGEQGSAKSTCAQIMGQLVDPSAVHLISPPKDQERWTASASSRWVLPVDNVSKIPDWWSDDLCRAVTGSGVLKRKLYSDDDLVAIYTKVCVILNGISLGSAMRSDLAERIVPFDLLRPSAYKTEEHVAAEFSRMHAGVLGALLDLAVGIMAAKPHVQPPTDLRMADAVQLFACYDQSLGLGPGTGALSAYRSHVNDAFEEALDDDLVAQAIVQFMTGNGAWEGRAAELYVALTSQRDPLFPLGELQTAGYWPRSPSQLMRVLPRSAPLFTRRGIRWTDLGRSNVGRRLRLEHVSAHADAVAARPMNSR